MNENDYNKILFYLDKCERDETYGQWLYKGDTDKINYIDEIGSSYGIRDEDIEKIFTVDDLMTYIYKKA